MAYSIRLPNGTLVENIPDDVKPEQAKARLIQTMGPKALGLDVQDLSTQELESIPSAPTSISDIGRSLGMGVVGGAKSVSDFFGAGSDASKYLGEKTEGLYQGLTPARKEEMERRGELQKRASQSGDVMKEVGSFIGGVTEAPLQSLAQAVGTSAPSILAGLAAIPAGAPASLAAGVGFISRAALGAAQGVGEYKGSIYDEVVQRYMQAGKSRPEAEALAVKAQEYTMDKAAEIGGSALLGALDALTGAEPAAGKAVRAASRLGKMTPEAIEAGVKALPEKAPSAPAFSGSVVRGVAAEAPLEGAQGAYGQYAQNVGVQQAGFEQDPYEGVVGAGARDALIGALMGGAASPMTHIERSRDFALDQFLRGEKEGQQVAEQEAEFRKNFGEAKPVEEPATQEMPGGYMMTRNTVGTQEVPESFGIFAEGSDTPLTTVKTQEEADAKLESLARIRKEQTDIAAQEIEKTQKQVADAGVKLETMEATGQANTDEYVQAQSAFKQQQDEATEKIDDLSNKISAYDAPLTAKPLGVRTDVQNEYLLHKDGQHLGTFFTPGEVEVAIKQLAPEAYVQVEQTNQRKEALKQTLAPMLQKFGLGDVGLNIEERLQNNAGGNYLKSLINISLTADNPVAELRHESIHALKDLGFFTPQQWKVLEDKARTEWIEKHLKQQFSEVNGKNVSRYEAYKTPGIASEAGLNDQELIEEAIADAFAAYSRGEKPPAGLISVLFKRLKDFFASFTQALRGAGIESAEDVFEKIEKGELTKKTEKKPEPKEKASLLRKAEPGEIDISTQNPQGKGRIYDPITDMLSIDESAVREAMKANPNLAANTIKAIKNYGFIPNDTPDDKVLEVFKANIVSNLLFLYDKVPADIRNRSKLWYDGANKIAEQMANHYGMSLRQVSSIMAAMSPQKDWFQNVSMAERAIDILTTQGDAAWSPNMLKYAESYVKEAKDRKEREKRQDAFERIKQVAAKGTTLNKMDEESAAAFIRAYDEAFHSRQYKIVTPEGGFGGYVLNNDGKPSTMMWSTYGPLEKTVSIFRDGSRPNVSQQLGFEHKIRSFYNNIANPNSDIDHVTIDTHAVAAGLFEALAGTDTEVVHNFGGTGKSNVIGVGGTYGLIADAYRDAARQKGIRAREMQSITWEAVRALFSEEVKSTIKPKIRDEWVLYKEGKQSFNETRQKVLEIAGQPDKLDEPDWVNSGAGQSVEDGGTSYDKGFVPEGGVRLREEKELREKMTFNLTAVTNSIPGLRDLYSKAMKGDQSAYELLQKVSESSLRHLLSGTKARLNIEYVKGIFLSDREPSISVSVAFDESEMQPVMAALAKFGDNYNQQQIHVRIPTIRKVGHDFGDGSYATPVYEIPLSKSLNDKDISSIIDQTGLIGFSVGTRETDKVQSHYLTAYWVAPNDIDEELESFDKFEQSVLAVTELAGAEGQKPQYKVERLYVYGEGYGAKQGYTAIQGNVRTKQDADTVTPRLIAEYLQGKPIRVFKQKDLTNKQTADQELLAKVFDDLPTKDLKNPLVRQAYVALNKELVKQYNAMPIKVELTEGKVDEQGNFIDIYRNSGEMRNDVSKNNKFKVFKTEPGTFGPVGANFKDHPLLKDSGLKDINGKPMLYNDLLRAVHDYYAHNLSEVQFGPKGEAAAWRNHMSVTMDPMARWALTAETRAQNAWQNFREGAEDVALKDRPFAEQKAALPPINFTFTGETDVDQIMVDYAGSLTPEQRLGSLPATSPQAKAVEKKMPKFSLRTYYKTAKEAEDAAYDQAPPSTPEFKRFFGASTIMDEGRPQPMYHGSASEFTAFLENKPIFISPEPNFAEQFAEDRAKDEGKSTDEMRVYPLWVRAETPFDYENREHTTSVVESIIAAQNLKGNDSNVRLGKSTPSVKIFRNEVEGGLWSVIEDPVFQKAIKNFGFDSFYVKEYGNKNLAVFKAEQVKSITGNIGDFSLETKDMRFSLKKVRYSSNRFDKLWNKSMYTQSDAENKTKGYLAFVNPMEFVRATSSFETFERLLREQEPLDIERMNAYDQVPFLSVSEKNGDWKITGHEGRHRMLALNDEGYREVPIYIHLQAEDAKSIPVKALTAEHTNAMSSILMVAEVEPLSYANKNKALEKFTRMNSKIKYSLPPVPGNIESRVNETTTVREQKGFTQRIVEAIAPKSASHFRQAYINRYNQMSVYDKLLAEKMGGSVLLADQSAESAALMSDVNAGVAASAMGFGDRHGGIPILRNGITTIDRNVKGLIASLSPLAKYGDPKVYRHYQYWAMVKRGQRLNKQGKLTGIDSADVAYAKQLEKLYPEFAQVQQDLIAFNNGLVQYMVDTGVLSKARGAEYVKYADYVPFYRQMEGEDTIGPNLFQSLSGVKPPKKLKGANIEEAPLADFLETLVRNTQSSIAAGMKNYAAQRAINVVSQVKVPGMGAERLNTKQTGPNIINVLEKGEIVSYRTPDNLLIDAVSSLNMTELPFMGILSAPANLLRGLVTKDPGFMMANLLRDSLSAWTTSGVSMTPIAGTVINFGKVLARKSPGFEAMQDAGIIGGYELSDNIERSGQMLSQDLDKKAGKKDPAYLRPFTSLWEGLERGTTASDAATRALVYERVLAETGNEAEALSRAMEVMNFHRKGNSPLIRVLTAAVPFFNARVQGLDLFYRASTGNMNMMDAKAIQRKFWARGMTMMALSGMYWMMVSDSEEYKKQEEETKDNNWIIPSLGIKIPTPFEVGVLFKVVPERIAAYMFGNDTGEDLRQSIYRNALSTFAFNPIPQTVKPIVEATTNFNFFTWRPIVGQGMADLATEFQVGPGTSKMAEFLGKNLGLSPMKVDHIIKGYTGTMGMYAIDTIDMIADQFSNSPKASKRFEQLPIIKRFAVDPEARGKITEYYELKNAVDTTVKTMKMLEGAGKPEEFANYIKENVGLVSFKDYVSDLEKDMKEFRDLRRTIQNAQMSGDQKRDSLKAIGQAENNLVTNIQTVKRIIAQIQ